MKDYHTCVDITIRLTSRNIPSEEVIARHEIEKRLEFADWRFIRQIAAQIYDFTKRWLD